LNFSIRDEIIIAICYASIFNDALTKKELERKLNLKDNIVLDKELDKLLSEKKIRKFDNFYFLNCQVNREFKNIKKEHKYNSIRLIEKNRFWLNILCKIKFIKFIAVTGSVAHFNAKKGGDLDLFIITKKNRLHIVTTFLSIVYKIYRVLKKLNFRNFNYDLCPNYMLELSNLEIKNKSYYTAHESINLIIVKDDNIYNRFLNENLWIRRYFPRKTINECKKTLNEDFSLLKALNIILYLACYSYSNIKQSILKNDLNYSIKYSNNRPNSINSRIHVGGGYQPQIMQKFCLLHSKHFMSNQKLYDFLFPMTYKDGIMVCNKLYKSKSGNLNYE
tara:strand:+ start:198 stop:1196 length:999 start_codon:yes stop_codon:yes gene_type:complete